MFKKFILAILLMGFVVGQSGTLQASYNMYAGMIYHFGKFVQWPEDKKSGDFVIGVYGFNQLESALHQLAKSKKIGDRRIVIKEISSFTDGKTCNIIFVGRSKKRELSAVSAMAKGNSILVVTDYPGAIRSGSTINFVNVGNRIGFELNLDAAKGQGVKVSSELQKLAVK